MCDSYFLCDRYFLVDSEGKVLKQQEGMFRSNCMDCLDRTNVIQSLLARRSLQSQLEVGIAMDTTRTPVTLTTPNQHPSYSDNP